MGEFPKDIIQRADLAKTEEIRKPAEPGKSADQGDSKQTRD